MASLGPNALKTFAIIDSSRIMSHFSVSIVRTNGLASSGARTSADTVMSKFRYCINTGVAFDGLTHWGRVTHICVGKLTIIGSNNGLSPRRRQAIIWTNAGIVLIGPLGTNFSEISIGIQTFSFKKMQLKMSSAKWRPFVSASMC